MITSTAPRPGTSVTTRSDPAPRGLSSDSGTFFAVVAAQKGPNTKAVLCQSLEEVVANFGTRQSFSNLYDGMETYFREGGQRAYITRTCGPAAAVATRTLLDASAGNSLTVQAKNPGTWGNGLSVAVTAPTGSSAFIVTVTQSGVMVDQSPLCASQSDAVNWSHNSSWVNVIIPTSSPSTLTPAVAAAAALSGGADDTANITDNIRVAALANFTADLGGGQVAVPGNTSGTVRTALNAHAAAFNRQALLDATDQPSRSAAVTEASALQAVGNEFSAIFGPNLYIPGLTNGLPSRIIPPSYFVAALMARNDATRSVNEPSMGDLGMAQWVVDVTQPSWTDTDRDLMNSAGYNVIRALGGQVQLFGYRTLANPVIDSTWLALSNQRLREQIATEALAIGKTFVGRQIDGKGRVVAQFGNQLRAMLMRHYLDGALFGTTDNGADAFFVDTDSVNTPATLANNELHAALSVKMSPFAEAVVIEITAVALTASL